jgi:hypothetical protein
MVHEFQRASAQRTLVFAPLAYLKLQFFCHLGHTEIAGFGISAKNNLLYIEDFVTVRQLADAAFVSIQDEAVADFTDRCIDAGLPPQRFLRIWCHTHPGSSPEPSSHDEETFQRVFGSCDWAIMFIMSRTARTYARLSLNVGPGLSSQLQTAVDWSAWPSLIVDPQFSTANLLASWQAEFAANIQMPIPALPSAEAYGWDWRDFETALLEESEHHERTFYDDIYP